MLAKDSDPPPSAAPGIPWNEGKRDPVAMLAGGIEQFWKADESVISLQQWVINHNGRPNIGVAPAAVSECRAQKDRGWNVLIGGLLELAFGCQGAQRIHDFESAPHKELCLLQPQRGKRSRVIQFDYDIGIRFSVDC